MITGGAGFIGSHTAVELLAEGHDVLVVDDLRNSSPVAVDRIAELAGRRPAFERLDVRETDDLVDAVVRHGVVAVVHFAALKAVGESVAIPLEYYGVNLGTTLSVLAAMRRTGVTDLVFSSSCSIYGATAECPIAEDAPPAPTNPYARSKWMSEQILEDACASHPDLSVTSLRYFNPTGAHPSGRLGEDPRGTPNNLVPFVAQVAAGRRPCVEVFGDDYSTPDGTGVRDYLHVVDLAQGHHLALERYAGEPGLRVLNLGTGRGTSVLELVAAFGRASGREIPVRVVGRRPGDVDSLVADPTRAAVELGWSARRDLDEMCSDVWRFQLLNPQGYAGSGGTGADG